MIRYNKLILALVATIGMCIPACSDVVMKSLSTANYSHQSIYLNNIDGLTLFSTGAGVNRMELLLPKYGSGPAIHSHSTVDLKYPIIVEWTVEGASKLKSKSFSALDGFTKSEINEEATIWLYFDKSGEPHFKLYQGDWMVGRRQLEKDIFGRVWKTLTKTSYYAEDTINIKRISGLGEFDVTREDYTEAEQSKGINRLKLRGNKLNFSEFTYDKLYVDYPIKVSWTIGDSSDIKTKSFDSISGFSENTITESATIWLYFDKNGEPHIEFVEDEWNLDREQLEERVGTR